jgi:hypothetical protein
VKRCLFVGCPARATVGALALVGVVEGKIAGVDAGAAIRPADSLNDAEAGVFGCECVSVVAVRLRNPERATLHIDPMGHSFKVGRSHASAYAAEMITLHPFFNWPKAKDVCHTPTKTAVAIWPAKRSPQPAIAQVGPMSGYGPFFIDLRPEAYIEWSVVSIERPAERITMSEPALVMGVAPGACLCLAVTAGNATVSLHRVSSHFLGVIGWAVDAAPPFNFTTVVAL